METVSNTEVTPTDAKRMLVVCGFSLGQKVQVFDGQKWEKTGDIGDNECMWIEATITGCNVNDYKELLIEALNEVVKKAKELEEYPCYNCQGGGCPVCGGWGVIKA